VKLALSEQEHGFRRRRARDIGCEHFYPPGVNRICTEIHWRKRGTFTELWLVSRHHSTIKGDFTIIRRDNNNARGELLRRCSAVVAILGSGAT